MDHIITEKWDPETDEWIFHPDLIAVTGLGGDYIYEDVEEGANINSIKKKILKYHGIERS